MQAVTWRLWKNNMRSCKSRTAGLFRQLEIFRKFGPVNAEEVGISDGKFMEIHLQT
jgi:hypothetical protein